MGRQPAEAAGRDQAPPPARPQPILDLRRRWAAGRVLLGLAAAFTLLALTRPLSNPAAWPSLRLLLVLGLGLGVAASALLSSLKGQGLPARLALYAFLSLSLDGLGQVAAPSGWPSWPLLVLLVGGVAVAEPLAVALGVAGLASLLAVAAAVSSDYREWQPAVAACVGYVGLVLALHQALLGEKRRLAATLDELTALQTGIDLMSPDGTQRLAPATRALREVSAEGRRARQVERAHERDEFLRALVALARGATRAHTALFFDLDPARGLLVLRAWDGPGGVAANTAVPAGGDPFGFVLERGQPFYATDYRKLLWALPWHAGGEVRVGTLLAVPQRFSGVVTGVLAVESLETQAFGAGEEQLLSDFARLAGEMGQRLRSLGDREELGLESSAIYAALQQLKTLESLDTPATVHRFLLRSAENLLPLEAAAVVRTDGVRYTVEAASGWAAELEGQGEAVDAATWAAWVTRSSEGGTRVGDLAERGQRMPVLVLHEGSVRSEALLAFPLKVALREAPHHLGAFLVMGRSADLTVQAQRVLEVLAQQAAAVLRIHELTDGERRRAMEDGLTGLLNRRAFDQELARAISNADRRGGKLSLLLLDLDHFKKLNDTYGHPAGDAALRGTAQTLARLLRKGDLAARYGGEEFVVILPEAEAGGATQLAERIRKAIESQQLVFEGARLPVAASLGLAVWPADGKTQEALLAAADRALYAAKQAGRNRVVAAATLPAPAPDPAP